MQVRLVGSNKRTKVAITESSRWLPTLCPVRSHFISCNIRAGLVRYSVISSVIPKGRISSGLIHARVIVGAQSSPQLSKLVADGALRHQRISWGVYTSTYEYSVSIYLCFYLYCAMISCLEVFKAYI